MSTTRQNSRRGFVTLYAAPNVASLNCQYGQFFTEEDGTIEVPEAAVDLASSHGFYKSKELLAAALAPAKKPQPADGTGIPRHPEASTTHVVERIVIREPAQKTPEEQLAKATRFDLREYCEANGIEIPARTDNKALKALVLAHMKAEAAEAADGAGDGTKGDDGEGKGKSEADEE